MKNPCLKRKWLICALSSSLIFHLLVELNSMPVNGSVSLKSPFSLFIWMNVSNVLLSIVFPDGNCIGTLMRSCVSLQTITDYNRLQRLQRKIENYNIKNYIVQIFVWYFGRICWKRLYSVQNRLMSHAFRYYANYFERFYTSACAVQCSRDYYTHGTYIVSICSWTCAKISPICRSNINLVWFTMFKNIIVTFSIRISGQLGHTSKVWLLAAVYTC